MFIAINCFTREGIAQCFKVREENYTWNLEDMGVILHVAHVMTWMYQIN